MFTFYEWKLPLRGGGGVPCERFGDANACEKKLNQAWFKLYSTP